MKKVFVALFSVFTVLFFISCGSKPVPETPSLEAPVTDEIVEEKEETVQEEEPEIPETEEISEEEFAALIAKIDGARESAVMEGADENASDLLNLADKLYSELKEDKKNLVENADSLVEMYDIIAKYSKALKAKNEIDENDLAKYAQKDYDAGTADLKKAKDLFVSSENMISAKSSVESAFSKFNTVINVAYKKMAKEQRTLAYQAKVNADSVKAGVSQRERYNVAADDFKNGDSLYSMQSPKKALEKYVSATEKFSELFEEVSEKRAAAQAAIDAAKKKVLESSQFAADADQKAPITEKVDGIEDENTVLLEDDDYENPEEAEVEIAETLDEDSADELNEENSADESADSAEKTSVEESEMKEPATESVANTDEQEEIEENVQDEVEVE